MAFEGVFPYLFVGMFALVAGGFLFGVIKHGGFKAAMFGAPIERTVGEVSGGKSRFGSTVVKVHLLGGSEKSVGVEFVAKSVASYQMMPFTLSVAETRKLISLLESAVRGR